MSQATYRKEVPNAPALLRVNTWLRAVGVPVSDRKEDGIDLTVICSDGSPLFLVVTNDCAALGATVPHLVVKASDITSRHTAIAMTAFHAITSTAGYGEPMPVDRGPAPEHKLGYEDNFEMVAMRHREFRRVPNPPPEELASYDSIINKAVARFLRVNQIICARHGLEASDLKTYAQVWACNYIGLYKVAAPTNHDNERKLYAHLSQRFGNFIEVFLRKEANCVVDSDTACTALYGRPAARIRTRRSGAIDPTLLEPLGLSEEGLQEEPEVEAGDEPLGDALVWEMPDYTQLAEEEQVHDLKKRRVTAKKALAEALAAMDHETLIRVLTEASENRFICYDAQAEARRQLRLHAITCQSCSSAEVEVQDQLPGEEPLRDGELS